MKNLLIESGIDFDGDYIKIPPWCKRIKIDIGLSENAPQSQIWLERATDLIVFGFEANINSINKIKAGNSSWPIKLDTGLINNKIYLINCALSNVTERKISKFYLTSDDPGCSSLLVPKEFDVDGIIEVETWSLAHFLKYIPFEYIKYVDFVKTDCQGTDIQILQGCEGYLSKIAIYTCEAESDQYVSSNNKIHAIKKIFHRNGFFRMNTLQKLLSFGIFKNIETDDPTFINKKLKKQALNNNVTAYQRG